MVASAGVGATRDKKRLANEGTSWGTRTVFGPLDNDVEVCRVIIDQVHLVVAHHPAAGAKLSTSTPRVERVWAPSKSGWRFFGRVHSRSLQFHHIHLPPLRWRCARGGGHAAQAEVPLLLRSANVGSSCNVRHVRYGRFCWSGHRAAHRVDGPTPLSCVWRSRSHHAPQNKAPVTGGAPSRTSARRTSPLGRNHRPRNQVP